MCQSGCILESLDNMLSEHELMMPLDLGAKGRLVHSGFYYVAYPNVLYWDQPL